MAKQTKKEHQDYQGTGIDLYDLGVSQIQPEIDQAEQMVLGSYQQPRQYFQDLPEANRPQLRSFLTPDMVYGNTLSQFVGSTAPFEIALDNLGNKYKDAISTMKGNAYIDEVLRPDQTYRQEILDYYNNKIDSVASDEEKSPRKTYGELLNVAREFKNDKAIKAMMANVQAREAFRKKVEDTDVDSKTKDKLLHFWDNKYAQQVGIGGVNREFYQGYNSKEVQEDPEVVKRINDAVSQFATNTWGGKHGNVTFNRSAEGLYTFHDSGGQTISSITEKDLQAKIMPILKEDRKIQSYFDQNAMIDSLDFNIDEYRKMNPNKSDEELWNDFYQHSQNKQWDAVWKNVTKKAFVDNQSFSDRTGSFQESTEGKLAAKKRFDDANKPRIPPQSVEVTKVLNPNANKIKEGTISSLVNAKQGTNILSNSPLNIPAMDKFKKEGKIIKDVKLNSDQTISFKVYNKSGKLEQIYSQPASLLPGHGLEKVSGVSGLTQLMETSPKELEKKGINSEVLSQVMRSPELQKQATALGINPKSFQGGTPQQQLAFANSIESAYNQYMTMYGTQNLEANINTRDFAEQQKEFMLGTAKLTDNGKNAIPIKQGAMVQREVTIVDAKGEYKKVKVADLSPYTIATAQGIGTATNNVTGDNKLGMVYEAKDKSGNPITIITPITSEHDEFTGGIARHDARLTGMRPLSYNEDKEFVQIPQFDNYGNVTSYVGFNTLPERNPKTGKISLNLYDPITNKYISAMDYGTAKELINNGNPYHISFNKSRTNESQTGGYYNKNDNFDFLNQEEE